MDLPITHTDEEALPVVLGVDTHVDAHVAVALDGLGGRLGHKTVPATEAGYALVAAWAEEFGGLERAGIEGSGSFGVGLTRFLRERGVEVFEVNRPNRQHRRRFGKHDTADAEAAARTRYKRTLPPASPRLRTAQRRWCVLCAWCAVRRSTRRVRRRPKPTPRDVSWSPRQRNSGRSCAASRRLGWSPRPRASVPAPPPTACGVQRN